MHLVLKKGHRILKIAFVFVEALRTNESRYTLPQALQTVNSDIACIQETRNDRIDTQSVGGTKYFTDVVIRRNILI